MVGQGLGRSIEAALEWLADYARDEERVLYYLSRPSSFLEGGAGDQQVVDIQQCAHAVAAKSCYYNGHDARPNPGRSGPPERQRRMGKFERLDGTVVAGGEAFEPRANLRCLGWIGT
jgi:hypothetical protein